MKLITRQTLAAEVAQRWKSRYYNPRDGAWYTYAGGNVAEKYEALLALGSSPLPEDVDKVIGNDSWTIEPRCHECGANGGPVVQLGEEPDYESSTACICPSCLNKALYLGERSLSH
jgi:hypothetical protein